MSIFKRRPLVVFAGLALTLAVACTKSHPQSTFDTQGPVSESQANIFYIITYAGLVVFEHIGFNQRDEEVAYCLRTGFMMKQPA